MNDTLPTAQRRGTSLIYSLFGFKSLNKLARYLEPNYSYAQSKLRLSG